VSWRETAVYARVQLEAVRLSKSDGVFVMRRRQKTLVSTRRRVRAMGEAACGTTRAMVSLDGADEALSRWRSRSSSGEGRQAKGQPRHPKKAAASSRRIDVSSVSLRSNREIWAGGMVVRAPAGRSFARGGFYSWLTTAPAQSTQTKR